MDKTDNKEIKVKNIDRKRKVTIIIPIYKTEKYLRKTVKSVLEQSYENIDVILVDDGSPDNCPLICDQIASENDNVKVIHKKNGGLSSARNAGLDATSPETSYILFLDSDDCLVHDAVAGLVQKAIDTNADMVIPDRYIKTNRDTACPAHKAPHRFHPIPLLYLTAPASM